MSNDIKPRVDGFAEFSTPRLKRELDNLSKQDTAMGRGISLYHDRNAKTLLALFFPVLGMAVLLVGGYRRSGFTLRIIAGVLMMAGLDSFRGATRSWVIDSPAIWPAQYLSPILSIALIVFLLWVARRNLRDFNPFKRSVLA